MNSDNIVARIDATFENTLQLNAELGEVTQIGKCKVLYGTTEEWNNQPELVAKEGYIYIYSDHKQNEDEQNIASFKVGDGSSLLIELPFTDDIIYEDIAALQTVVADIPTTASELPYDNSVSGLESTNVNDAIDEVEDRVDEAEGDIVTLDTNKVDKVDPTTSGALSHTGNATVSGTVTAQNGFVGNLTGTASSATHAVSADSATSASSADEATHATSADSAINATNAGNANTVNNLTVLTAVPANAKFTDTDELASLKDVSFTNLTDGQVIVWDAISEKFKNITLPDAMVFRGSLGTGGTISVLPVDGSASVGDTYKVITDGTYAGQVAKVGDTFICLTKTSSANTWVHIPSGDEPSGTVTSVKIEGSCAIVVDDESAITTSGVRTISHANSGATAGSYGDSSAQTPAYGATFKVPYITVDAKGHITGISEHTVKIPESDTINVVANPSGTATTDLTKIQVGNDIYAIPEGGTDVEVTQIQSTGTKIATITVDNVPTDLYAPEGGGSGGHTILDDSGTTLTQRTNMQFKGAYSEDNSVDGVTEVNISREMTYAEFEQLSDDEKVGLINVTDVTPSGDDRFQPVIYSTEEREIGVYIDGKPLYCKVLVNSSTVTANNNVWITIPLNNQPTNIDKFVFGALLADAYPVSYEQPRIIYDSGNAIFKMASVQNSSYVAGKLLIYAEYTKTTDQPGSGTWTPQGVPAVHYSTDEHIVGTWIDGSTLYEKTFFLSQRTPITNDYTTYIIDDITIYDIDNIIGCEIFDNNSDSVPLTKIAYLERAVDVIKSNNKLIAFYNANNTYKMTGFILRYTKSST